MELWIRSQNKQILIKTRRIEYSNYNGAEIYAYDNDDYSVKIGRYKTKERAIEVLDEIENILKPQEYEIPTTRNTFIFSTNISNYVYQMPKE